MSVGIRVLAGLIAIGAGFFFAARHADTRPKAPTGTATAPGFAVVELFTSEGCSSCPPADVALAKLATTYAKQKRPVFTLAFHVDYWDRLGWTDPYGSAGSTARQRAYVVGLGLKSMYTPQMVVNGRREFVGSNAMKGRAEVAAALERTATVALSAKAAPEGAAWRVVYAATGAPAGLQIHAALVEGGLVSEVRRGENEGKTLAHDHVVRAFATVTAMDGELLLRPTADVDPEKATVVVYAQDPGTMAVVAATRATL